MSKAEFQVTAYECVDCDNVWASEPPRDYMDAMECPRCNSWDCINRGAAILTVAEWDED